MAEHDQSAPPSDETPSLPTNTVTESREVVVEPSVEKSSGRIGTSISEAFDEAQKEKSLQVLTDEQPAGKPSAKKEPEKAPEEAPSEPGGKDIEKAQSDDPRSAINKMIEEEEKSSEGGEDGEGGEPAKVPEEQEEKIEFPEGVKSEKARKRYIELHSQLREKTQKEAELSKALEAERARLKELEASRSTEPAPEEKAQREAMENELLQLRRQYQLDNDPAIKQKYDAVIQDSEKTIISTLKKYGIVEQTAKIIEAEGGFANFSGSQKPMELADGEKITYSEAANSWINEIRKLSVKDARVIESAVDEQIRTENARRRFIEEEKAKAKEWFDGQSKTYQASVEQQQKSAQEQKQKIESFVAKVTTETPWMKDVEIPATATPEERQALEQDKRFRKGLRDTLTATMSSQSIDDLLNAALDSVGYLYERRENAKLAKENKALKARISKMQGGSATTPRSGSILAPKGDQRSEAPQRIYDGAAADNLSREFDRIASGG